MASVGDCCPTIFFVTILRFFVDRFDFIDSLWTDSDSDWTDKHLVAYSVCLIWVSWFCCHVFFSPILLFVVLLGIALEMLKEFLIRVI